MDVAGSVDGDQNAVAVAAGPSQALGSTDPRDRWQITAVSSWHERDTMLSKGRGIAIAMDAGAPLRVDTIGLGKGVFDSAKQSGYPTQEYRASDKAKHSDRFINRKAEDAWLFRAILEKDLIRLPNDQRLKSQLRAMKYEIMQSGKLRVVDPADSPDLADAIIIALSPSRMGYRAISSGLV